MKYFILVALYLGLTININGQEPIDKLLKLGKQQYLNEKYSDAMISYNKAYKLSPKSYEAIMGLADSRHKLDLFMPAIELYNEAETVNNTDPNLFSSRGIAYIFIQKYKKALKDFDQALELNPEIKRVFYYKGYANNELGRYKQSIEDYSNEIEQNPEYGAAYYNRGAAKAQLKSYEAGMQDFELAVKKDPGLKDVKLNIALVKLGMKKYEEAIKDLDKVIFEDEENISKAFYYRAEAKYKLFGKEKACEDWEKAANLGYEQAIETVNTFCGIEVENKKKREIEIVF
jgi:tetratricopeptide (TPR) repeat protein